MRLAYIYYLYIEDYFTSSKFTAIGNQYFKVLQGTNRVQIRSTFRIDNHLEYRLTFFAILCTKNRTKTKIDIFHYMEVKSLSFVSFYTKIISLVILVLWLTSIGNMVCFSLSFSSMRNLFLSLVLHFWTENNIGQVFYLVFIFSFSLIW